MLTLDTSVSTYVATQPKFLCILVDDTSIYLTKTNFGILDTSISTYLLVLIHIPLAHSWHFCIILDDASISMYYLLDHYILANPWLLHVYVSTWPKYSFASLTPPFLYIFLTIVHLNTLYTSISMYLLVQNILLCPLHLHIYLSPWPWLYSCSPSLTCPFLHYLLDQNILLHSWHLHFYVSNWPKYSWDPWRFGFYVSTWPCWVKSSSAFFILVHLEGLRATLGLLSFWILC